MVGAGALLVLDLFIPMSAELTRVTQITFVAMLVVDLFVTLVGEFGMPHASEVAAKAAHDISHGKYKDHFLDTGSTGTGAALQHAVAPIVGLYLFEYGL